MKQVCYTGTIQSKINEVKNFDGKQYILQAYHQFSFPCDWVEESWKEVKFEHKDWCMSNKYHMPEGEENPQRGRFGCCTCINYPN
jgi:hypothetical protein